MESLSNLDLDDIDSVNEFKSDVQTYYKAQRALDKQSGSHKHSEDIKNLRKMTKDPSYTVTTNMKEKELKDKTNKIANKAQDIQDKANEKQRAKNIKRAEKGKEIKYTSRQVDATDQFAEKHPKAMKAITKAGTAYGKHLARKAMKEAVEEFYYENGLELDDYEAGCIDMFVESVLSEKSNFDKYIDNKVKKAEEYQKKADKFKDLEKRTNNDTSSKTHNRAKYQATENQKKADEAKNVGVHTNYRDNFGNITRTIDRTAKNVKDVGKESRKGQRDTEFIDRDKNGNKIGTADANAVRRIARNEYRNKAANNGTHKTAINTTNRKPGTYLNN